MAACSNWLLYSRDSMHPQDIGKVRSAKLRQGKFWGAQEVEECCAEWHLVVSQGSGGGPELHLELARLQDENSILRKELTEAKAVRSPQPDGAPGDFQAAEAVKEIQLVNHLYSAHSTMSQKKSYCEMALHL